MKKLSIFLLTMGLAVSLSSCKFVENLVNGNNQNNTNNNTNTNTPTTVITGSVDTNTTPTTIIPTTTIESSIEPSDSTTIPSITTTGDISTSTDEIEKKDIYYAKNYLSTKGDKYVNLYNAIFNGLNSVYLSNKTITDTKNVNVTYTNPDNTTTTKTETYYVAAQIEFYKQYNVESDAAYAILKCVVLDHPEFYFVNSLSTVSSTKIGDKLDSQTLNVFCSDEYYEGDTRALYNQKLNEYKTNIDNLITNPSSDKHIIRTVHDYIINNGAYAFEADGVTPSTKNQAHNLMGLVIDKKGVCESYSELFKYLLNQYNIPSIIVSGTGINSAGSGGHAWNYVNIDNKYYGFDLTWDDPVSNSGDKLEYDYFAKGKNSDFLSSHVPSITDDFSQKLNFLYALPELATLSKLLVEFV